jgi:hypothetical protein
MTATAACTDLAGGDHGRVIAMEWVFWAAVIVVLIMTGALSNLMSKLFDD